ncbi:MAG: trehalose-phosphatase [Myxococcota bacterium]|jgi:trehalose 6-phosphate synthase/phosphatase|nr:trehalose-phosphatase [Myxococcota bacterium]
MDATDPLQLARSILAQREASEAMYLLLDYDGTLVPFAPTPEEAIPDAALHELLQGLLADPLMRVWLISGRGRDSLERWFPYSALGIVAEYGYWRREAHAPRWHALELDTSWIAQLLPPLERSAARLPGALVEHKAAALAWHYRRSPPHLVAAEREALLQEIAPLLEAHRLEAVHGACVLELRAPGVNKGAAIRRMSVELANAGCLLALGDDWADQDFFDALPEHAWTVCVGEVPLRARARVKDVQQARLLLDALRRGR